jgi:hypothetical protein
VPLLPGETARETEIRAPLSTDDETIDQAMGGELVELARAIGAARGYTLCRCFETPSAPPADVERMFSRCAADESGVWQVANDDRARCITERMARVPGFDELLRCLTKLARVDGLLVASWCREPSPDIVYPPENCVWPPGSDELIAECRDLVFCDDETWGGPPCNGVAECQDLSDESDCYEVSPNTADMLLCGSEILFAFSVCSTLMKSDCAYEQDPPMCDAAREYKFLCFDGSEVDTSSVCDRVEDCPDGRDESLCLRSEE